MAWLGIIFFIYVVMLPLYTQEKNHLDNTGIEPGSPALQASTLSITPSPLGQLSGANQAIARAFPSNALLRNCLMQKKWMTSQLLGGLFVWSPSGSQILGVKILHLDQEGGALNFDLTDQNSLALSFRTQSFGLHRDQFNSFRCKHIERCSYPSCEISRFALL